MLDGIALAVASVAGAKVREDKLKGIRHDLDKSRFNRTGFPFDKESRRDTQFKFFGYKPKRFISVYAKKPKVRVKVKTASVKCNENNYNYLIGQGNAALLANMQNNQLNALHQLGMQGSAMACSQMAQSPGQAFLMGRAAAGGLGGGQTRSQLY